MCKKWQLALTLVSAASIFFGMFNSVVSAQDAETIVHNFSGTFEGGFPFGGVIVGRNGHLYGTAEAGGTNSDGAVFEIQLESSGTWTLKTIYSFNPFVFSDGANPVGGLVFDNKNNLYGVTGSGGANFSGAVFELSPSVNGTWSEKVLYSFTGGDDGSFPQGGLVLDTAGNLFGTTYLGGKKGFGIVFELIAATDGTFTEKILHTFTGANDGASPYAGKLAFDKAGRLYGATFSGGADDYGVIFQLTPQKDGTWTERVVKAFAGGADGIGWPSTLVFDKNGNLYASAVYSVIELTQQSDGTWTENTLHNFSGGADGANVEGGLTIDAAGNLYGTTLGGEVIKERFSN